MTLALPPGTDALERTLEGACDRMLEEPVAAGALAREAASVAAARGDDGLVLRALALRGLAAVQLGRLELAFRFAAEVEARTQTAHDAATAVDVHGFRAQLAFLTGAYRQALDEAMAGIAVADADGAGRLRVRARRRACIVLGNLEDPGWPAHLDELVGLCEAGDEPWELAATLNDLATFRVAQGAPLEALEILDRAAAVVAPHRLPRALLDALMLATRSEALNAAGRPEDAAIAAATSVQALVVHPEPNPYLLGMAALVHVQALVAAGRPQDARDAAQPCLDRLGDATPHARAVLLRELAAALRSAGQVEDAYDVLLEASELERVAYRQFTELQLDVRRANAAGAVAREEADAMREQAERDPLTGLHNRRHLLRVAAIGGPIAVAAVDLDHFKAVNDRFGHEVGDQVLTRAAQVLRRVARAGDVVARTGGEEFVVLMPDIGLEAARAVAERLRLALRAEPWALVAPGLAVTASVGVAAADAPLEAVLGVADRHLYAAKRAGRDRVV